MKRTMLVTLAALLAVAAGAGSLRAADRGDDKPADRKAEMAARMQEHMKAELGLTDAEAGKVKTIFEESRKASEPLKQELKVALEKLRWQVDAKADAKDLDATLSQVDKARKALADQRETAIARLNKELPAEARAKLALSKADHMKRRMMMMRHGMMGLGHGAWGGHGGRGWGERGGMPPPPPPPGDEGDGD